MTGELYRVEHTTYGTWQVNQYDFARKVETMFETGSLNTARIIERYLNHRMMVDMQRAQSFADQAARLSADEASR